MEGEISKHYSTESVASSRPPLSDSSFDLPCLEQQISDCIAASRSLLQNQIVHQAQINNYQYIFYQT